MSGSALVLSRNSRVWLDAHSDHLADISNVQDPDVLLEQIKAMGGMEGMQKMMSQMGGGMGGMPGMPGMPGMGGRRGRANPLGGRLK